MAEIMIDGVSLTVPDGKSVLECALENGIYIPHLCHHPDLPDNGSTMHPFSLRQTEHQNSSP